MKTPYPRPTKFKICVKKSVAGFGLFADETIPKNKFVIEYWGPIIDDAAAEKISGKYLFGLGKNKNIAGAHRKNIARYINHSCRPNCEAIQTGQRVFIRSRKKIKPGEELTYDYGTEYFDGHIGANNCRCVKCAGTPKK
jgi:SET domain-containing protein